MWQQYFIWWTILSTSWEQFPLIGKFPWNIPLPCGQKPNSAAEKNFWCFRERDLSPVYFRQEVLVALGEANFWSSLSFGCQTPCLPPTPARDLSCLRLICPIYGHRPWWSAGKIWRKYFQRFGNHIKNSILSYLSYLIISYNHLIISYHILSYLIISYHILPYLIISYRILFLSLEKKQWIWSEGEGFDASWEPLVLCGSLAGP